MKGKELPSMVCAYNGFKVKDLGLTPTHREAVHQIVGSCFVKHIDKAGVSVRSTVNDDLGLWGQTARLLHIERSFTRSCVGAQIAAAVNVHLGNTVREDIEVDRAPVGVGIIGNKIGPRWRCRPFVPCRRCALGTEG